MFFKELVLIMEGVFCMCKFTTQLKAAFHLVGLCYVERLSRMLIYWKDQKSNRRNVLSAETNSHAYLVTSDAYRVLHLWSLGLEE